MPSVSVTREPAAQYEIRGGGGLKLHVQEWGDPHGPAFLLIHGWSQSQLCWRRQVESPLAETFRIVTFDNRGHGMSERPLTPEHYLDGQLWADDIAAIIEQTGLDHPILVAWSYGGFIVADYVRAYGQDKIGGINLVGGAVLLKPPSFDHIGPGFLENAEGACSTDLSTNIAAIRRFLRACTARPLSDDDWSAALSWNMVVPAEVRAALISRELDADDILSTLTVPMLVTHGRADAIVLPSMADHVLAVCETAEASWYEGSGHMPFWEDHERFNRELADFSPA
jgi:non-heme chloroperoxidase